jgi:hypothetical protein
MKTPNRRIASLAVALCLLTFRTVVDAEWITLQVPLTPGSNSFSLLEVRSDAANPNRAFPIVEADFLQPPVTNVDRSISRD